MFFFRSHIARSFSAIACTTALLATIAVTNNAAAQASTKIDDPILKAMQAELAREKGLILTDMQRPYFVEYRLEDISTYEAVAGYGALTREEQSHQRIVRVTVRIGDYASDSSGGRGDGAVLLAPDEDNAESLRYALWMATDDAYKLALRSYATKQAALKQFQTPPNHDDFAKAAPTVHIDPIVSLDLDRNEWKRRLIEASGVYAIDPAVKANAADVQYSVANLRALAINRYTVNTEGTIVRTGYTGYGASIGIGGQAPDGMNLARDTSTIAVSAKELEDGAAFRKRAIDEIKSFEELRQAPVVTAADYHGPVLFSGDAASAIINALFLPNVQATPPEMGTSARTRGAFNSSLHGPVLSDLLSVTDNPLEKTFNAHELMGAYTIDDEGVPAQSVDVVTKGKLQNYLIGRSPIQDFPVSNGHGRAAVGQPAHSHSGVLIVKAIDPLSSDALHQKLLALAKDRGGDVYEVETLGGPAEPRLLYRVHPDGSRQLVRGAAFDELDNRSLRSDIVAAGGQPYIDDTFGAIPQTTIAPSLLFGNVGIKRATEEQQKLPYYPPPPTGGK